MDILDRLARQALETVNSGYYTGEWKADPRSSLKRSLEKRRFSLIGELKYASPSRGPIRRTENLEQIVELLERYCTGISVLTEPKSFLGSMERFARVREMVDLPLLMKDFIITPTQIAAAEAVGADAILLIAALADRGYFDLEEMIRCAHEQGIEVLLEVHSREELETAVNTDADLLGVNNRDLRTLNTNVLHTLEIMGEIACAKPLVSESGYTTREEVLKVKDHVAGILVGGALMESDDIERKLRELNLCG